MNKCLVLLLVTLGLTSCTVKDDHYYQQHPKEIQKALNTCNSQRSPDVMCKKIEALASKMESLAYELQSSPQGFGTKILILQQTIVQNQIKLKHETNNPELKESINKSKQELAERLSVVKWLESPES